MTSGGISGGKISQAIGERFIPLITPTNPPNPNATYWNTSYWNATYWNTSYWNANYWNATYWNTSYWDLCHITETVFWSHFKLKAFYRSFSFDYEPNGILFGKNQKENCFDCLSVSRISNESENYLSEHNENPIEVIQRYRPKRIGLPASQLGRIITGSVRLSEGWRQIMSECVPYILFFRCINRNIFLFLISREFCVYF